MRQNTQLATAIKTSPTPSKKYNSWLELTIGIYPYSPYSVNWISPLAHACHSCYKSTMKHVHPPAEKETLIVRLRKIRGQIEAVERMVDADDDCSEILTQVVSARRAL